MRSLRTGFLREPLVHFLLLGAALFLLDVWLRPAAPGAGAGEIVVGEARIRSLAQNFARTWQRPPTREELDGLVESHVREEVLYREALALGLERDDTIVRRRMQQKMEFLFDEAAAVREPTDAELAEYLAAHRERFAAPPRARFEQVFLDPARRGPRLAADAQRLLEQLNRPGSAVDPGAVGDRLQLLDARYDDVPQFEVQRLFGESFARALFEQPTGRWVGPITSGYGEHLVRLEARQPGGVPALDEVRPLVEREWTSARRKAVAAEAYATLRAKYRVQVKMPESMGGPGPRGERP